MSMNVLAVLIIYYIKYVKRNRTSNKKCIGFLEYVSYVWNSRRCNIKLLIKLIVIYGFQTIYSRTLILIYYKYYGTYIYA